MREMNSNMIVLLDLGGVVLQPNQLPNSCINWKIINQLNTKYESGDKYTFSELHQEHNKLTAQQLSHDEFLSEIFKTLQVNTELIEIISNNFDIFIVSDNYKESVRYISEKYGFEEWSIKQIYSYDYKLVKSNPEFFIKLLQDNQEYDREDFILIDDSITKIESAASTGIKGILYQNNEQIKNELESILIKNRQ